MWGDPEGPIETVIGAGYDVDSRTQIWGAVEPVRSVDLEPVHPWQTPFEVPIRRTPSSTMERVWPQVRPWEAPAEPGFRAGAPGA